MQRVMLSQKLQDDLMSAYQQVHEGKRGHAAGDSDVEKQASQLASDVRYKAKGKVKDGASEEEKKKEGRRVENIRPFFFLSYKSFYYYRHLIIIEHY